MLVREFRVFLSCSVESSTRSLFSFPRVLNWTKYYFANLAVRDVRRSYFESIDSRALLWMRKKGLERKETKMDDGVDISILNLVRSYLGELLLREPASGSSTSYVRGPKRFARHVMLWELYAQSYELWL